MIFGLNKNDSVNQSIKYIARFLVKSLEKSNNIFGFTGSYDNKKIKFSICKKICEEILEYKKKVCMLDADYMLSNTEKFETKSLSSVVFDEIIQSEISNSSSSHDIVIINVPCVRSNIVSLDYLSLCNKIFFIERCMYTKYNDFEDILGKLKDNNLIVSGIISYS